MIKAGTATIEVAVEEAVLPWSSSDPMDVELMILLTLKASRRSGIPRGAASTTRNRAERGPLEGLTLHDWRRRSGVVQHRREPATIIGHAFGNRGERRLPITPRIVKQLILLAAGGAVSAPPKIMDALARVFDERLSRTEHLAAAVKAVFFERDHDPVSGSTDGIQLYNAQRSAADATPLASWWAPVRLPCRPPGYRGRDCCAGELRTTAYSIPIA